MNEDSLKHLTKAKGFLSQIEKLDPGVFAEQIIHSAYYAMRHAAMAVLVHAHGSVSTKHDRVIREFGQFARQMLGESGDAAGKAFFSAYNTRCTGDYDIDTGDLSTDARAIRVDAMAVVEICEKMIAETPASP